MSYKTIDKYDHFSMLPFIGFKWEEMRIAMVITQEEGGPHVNANTVEPTNVILLVTRSEDKYYFIIFH